MDEVSTAISAGSAGIKLFKDLTALARKRKDSEITEKITEAQIQFLELVNAYADLEERNRQLTQKLAARDELEWESNVYRKREGDELIGPFCPRCRDGGEFRQARMADHDGTWVCPACQHKELTPQKRRRRREAVDRLNR